MGGTVRDVNGQPVPGASVILQRRATTATGGSSLQLVAEARTDERGAFSLGVVPLETEIQFPLETAVRLDYEVSRAGTSTIVDAVTFSAPRAGNLLASIDAHIRVR